MVILKNNDITDLVFYLAAQKKDAVEKGSVTVAAGKEVPVKASDLGDVFFTFLNVMNPDNVTQGEWMIDLQ